MRVLTIGIAIQSVIDFSKVKRNVQLTDTSGFGERISTFQCVKHAIESPDRTLTKTPPLVNTTAIQVVNSLLYILYLEASKS